MLRVFTKIRRFSILGTLAATLAATLAVPSSAMAGKLSWLDDIVRQVVRDTRAEGRAGARTLERSSGRLLVREADESLETLARRSDDLARIARRGEAPTEALLESRFDRLVRHEPEAAQRLSLARA